MPKPLRGFRCRQGFVSTASQRVHVAGPAQEWLKNREFCALQDPWNTGLRCYLVTIRVPPNLWGLTHRDVIRVPHHCSGPHTRNSSSGTLIVSGHGWRQNKRSTTARISGVGQEHSVCRLCMQKDGGKALGGACGVVWCRVVSCGVQTKTKTERSWRQLLANQHCVFTPPPPLPCIKSPQNVSQCCGGLPTRSTSLGTSGMAQGASTGGCRGRETRGWLPQLLCFAFLFFCAHDLHPSLIFTP